MATKSMNDLFLATLRDIYYAERRLLKALPKMAHAAENEELKQAFTDHREETQQHVERLQQVFEAIGQRARGKTCEAIEGLIGEVEELLGDAPTPSAVRDAGLIACGQAVEHYEMARYGALGSWAEGLGHDEAAKLLQLTLAEEKAADALLNQIAIDAVNGDAVKAAA
ncbi:YciE/YciF ferroxidase family protein [Roseomonas rosulenta]|uniref:YciE/YciF ferroxidase family protein n=1 Tax=Roseomonas rosulenta TaxID=2748667 RepID=UPI0018DFD514|nr:ferritin-like domain-containing protein [Roseomonas rosulenta]